MIYYGKGLEYPIEPFGLKKLEYTNQTPLF
jgi:hypothetical protein